MARLFHDNNKSVTKFINEIEEKESKEKEKEQKDIEDNIQNTRIINKDSYFNSNNKEKKKKNSFLDELNFESNFNSPINSKDKNNDNLKQKNEIINKKIDLGLNLNNYNDPNDLSNLINKDNNEEFTFENAKRLKPLAKNNRRGSAKKF